MAMPNTTFIIGPATATRIFDQGETGGSGSARLSGLALQGVGRDHLGQLDEAPGGNPAPGPFHAIAHPAHDLRAEPNREALDLQAAPQRHPVMPIFMDKDRGAEEQEDREDHIDNVQKPHIR